MRKLDYYKRFTYIPNEVYDYLIAMEDAMAGDIGFVVFPAMTGTSANGPALEVPAGEANDPDTPYVASVTVKLMNQAGTQVMEWFNGTRKVTVDVTSTSGTITIDDGDTPAGETTFDLEFTNGVGTFTIALSNTWAANNTIMVNVDKDDNGNSVGVMGYTVKVENHYLIKIVADET